MSLTSVQRRVLAIAGGAVTGASVAGGITGAVDRGTRDTASPLTQLTRAATIGGLAGLGAGLLLPGAGAALGGIAGLTAGAAYVGCKLGVESLQR